MGLTIAGGGFMFFFLLSILCLVALVQTDDKIIKQDSSLIGFVLMVFLFCGIFFGFLMDSIIRCLN